MIKPIVKSEFIFSLPLEGGTAADAQVAQDLIDTLRAHEHECVGLAGNMIGARKRIIAFNDNGTLRTMFNPEITARSGAYETDEGCLSLIGKRSTTRYETIDVRWQDETMQWHTETFSGFTAQIIQHEVDHCNGIVI